MYNRAIDSGNRASEGAADGCGRACGGLTWSVDRATEVVPCLSMFASVRCNVSFFYLAELVCLSTDRPLTVSFFALD